jgi:hypothetical protein
MEVNHLGDEMEMKDQVVSLIRGEGSAGPGFCWRGVQ